MQTTPGRGLPYLTPTDKAKDIPEHSKTLAERFEQLMDDGVFQGEPGADGAPGLPGVNAVPADAAVATYLGTPGSATHEAALEWFGKEATTTEKGLMPATDRAALSGATSFPLPNTFMRRHSSGSVQVETGSSDKDAANKGYVDLRLAGVANAKFYGAKGDGIADDTAAIQAALSAAKSGLCIIPAGSYKIMATLIFPADIMVIATGATLFRGQIFSFCSNIPTSNSTTTGYNGPSNITIVGGTWDAKGHIYDTAIANTFTWVHARNITMRDVTLLNVAGAHAVEFDGIDGALLDNCNFYGYKDTGARDFSEAVQIDTATGGRGANDKTLCRNITMRGGQVGPSKELPSWPRGIGSHSTYADNATHKYINVDGVFFDKCLSMAIRGYGWDYVSIKSNMINGGCASNGIEVSTSDPGGTGGFDSYVVDVIIADNHIINVLDDGIYMQVKGARNIQRAVISRNIIDNPGMRGIYLQGAVNNAVVEGNITTAPGNAAITLNGTSGTLVYNNKARKTSTTSAALNILAGTTDTHHYLNDFRGYAANAVSNGGTGTLNPVPNFTA